jgi:chemotaxis family two-component system response regulator Rcp1
MHTAAPGRPIELLVVEDNAADIRLLQEVLQELTVPVHLQVAHDGEEALAFLRRARRYAQAARPDLILLDLNLPKKHGLEVLAELSADPQLRRIPSIVLSSSQAEQDVRQSYEHCANCYIAKPTELEQFRRAARLIKEFWLTLVILPSAAEGKEP